MRKDYDIILNTLFRTDNNYSSVSLSFAKEMAKTNRIFYVNHPYSYKDLWDGRKNDKVKERFGTIIKGGSFKETVNDIPENFIAYTPAPTFPINGLKPGKIYDSLYRHNRRTVLNTIQTIITENKLKNFIYLTCFDPFFVPVLPKEMGAALSIYQCIDDISTEPYVAKHGVRLEFEATRASDITLVTSTNLWRKFKEIQPETYILHNAVDISIFKNTAFKHFDRPAELANVTRKIIGFVGNLDPVRIDYPLLKAIALAHTDKTLVLVGPKNSTEIAEQGLDRMPNVILTGAKKITEVPQYLKFFDVAILPSLLNKMSLSVYPLKINEYLAAGKSIIATNFSEDIRSFSPLIRVANDHAHFINLIDAASTDYSDELIKKRMAVAEKNTWGDRVREFWEIIYQHEHHKRYLDQVIV